MSDITIKGPVNVPVENAEISVGPYSLMACLPLLDSPLWAHLASQTRLPTAAAVATSGSAEHLHVIRWTSPGLQPDCFHTKLAVPGMFSRARSITLTPLPPPSCPTAPSSEGTSTCCQYKPLAEMVFSHHWLKKQQHDTRYDVWLMFYRLSRGAVQFSTGVKATEAT